MPPDGEDPGDDDPDGDTTGPDGSFIDDSDGGITDASTDNYCEAERHETSRHPVDIYFVVDNSGSMSNEIARVRENINAFANKVANSGLDYRVFMISQKGTSSYAVCVPEPLASPNCETNPPRFYAINRTISSTNALVQLLDSYDKMTNGDPFSIWRNYTRFDSIKFFIVVTDDNSSLSAAKFEEQLFAKQPAGMFGTPTNRKYFFNSIVGWDGINPPPTTNACQGVYNSGIVYQELSLMTDGIIETICREDWSSMFDKMAEKIVKTLGCEFQVPQPENSPLVPELVEVQVALNGAAPTTMPRVLDQASCASEPDAFYFDSNDAPTTVKLCPGACSKVSSDPKAEVSVLVGCPAPPPR